MTALERIETAIKQLPPHELAKFRQWFTTFDNDAWDTQIERDAATGKLNTLAEEALAEYRSGIAIEI